MAEPFKMLTSLPMPLIRDNIDTDQIIPSREMKSTGKTGLADGLFAGWRYTEIGGREVDPDFVLNRSEYANSAILLGGSNFGCGSSREHAVWALAEYGFRCIIAPSFAPIFAGNCGRNGVLTIVLAPETIAQITCAKQPVTIDLAAQTITLDDNIWHFDIAAQAKAMLLEGLDWIDLTMKQQDAIQAWQHMDRKNRPWVYLDPPHNYGEGDHVQHGGGVFKPLPKTNHSVIRARSLRRSMTKPEVLLWQELRKRPGGLKFRRQHPAGPYVLDFYCAKASLCVEVDGEVHSMGDGPGKDQKRDAYMREYGIETVRISADEMKSNIENVVNYIVGQARVRLPLHRPSDGPPPQAELGEDKT